MLVKHHPEEMAASPTGGLQVSPGEQGRNHAWYGVGWAGHPALPLGI